jgi:hypothetical protein
LPAQGVVALLDFGGSGTGLTLADAGSNLEPIGETVRLTEFSGEQIDQAVLTHVLAVMSKSGQVDTASTTALGVLRRLRDQCRQAKERLSSETATVLAAELPGSRSDIRLTRTELESLIEGPFGAVVTALEEALDRNRIPPANLAAVATVGGGASIPLITDRLAERMRVPVVTTPLPQLTAAAGAALLAERGPAGDVPTGMATAPEAPTGRATAAWAAGAAGLAAGESATDGAASATFRALAWSQDDTGGQEVVPYAGTDYDYDAAGAGEGPQMDLVRDEQTADAEAAPLPWYRRPSLIFAAAATLLVLALGGLAITLTSNGGTPSPGQTSAPSPPAPAPPPPPQTVTVTGTPTTTVAPAPPPPTTTQAPTTTAPTTTTETTTTTTTTAPTTTTATTTTQPTTTPPTTTRTRRVPIFPFPRPGG